MDNSTKLIVAIAIACLIGFVVGYILHRQKIIRLGVAGDENLPFMPNLYNTGNAVQGAISTKLNSLSDKDTAAITQFGVNTYVNGKAGEFKLEKPKDQLGINYISPLVNRDSVSDVTFDIPNLGQEYDNNDNALGYPLGQGQTLYGDAYSTKLGRGGRLGMGLGQEDMDDSELPRPNLGQSFSDPTNVSTHIENKPLNLPLIQKTQGVDYIRGDLPIEPIRREWFDLARANPINLVAGGHNVLFGDKPTAFYGAKQQYESLGCGCAQSFLGKGNTRY